MDGTQTDTAIPSQSGSGSSGNEGALHFPESFRTGASPSSCFVLVSGGLTSLQSYSQRILLPQSTGLL